MAISRGTLLGAANVLVIAIGLGITAGDDEVTTLVVIFGGIPGLIAGGVLGWLARRLETRPPSVRITLLTVPAVGVVFVLASEFGMDASVPVACIPTIVAALILERWTRRVTPAPVPVAVIRAARE